MLKDKSGNSHEGREATGIRQRHTKKQENSEWIQDENLRDSAEREEYEMNEKRPTLNGRKKATGKRDPLHWFGLLVSPSLRFSQDHFKTGQSNKVAKFTYLYSHTKSFYFSYGAVDRSNELYHRARQTRGEIS